MFGKDGKYEQGSQLCGKIVVAGSLSFAGADHLVLFLKWLGARGLGTARWGPAVGQTTLLTTNQNQTCTSRIMLSLELFGRNLNPP